MRKIILITGASTGLGLELVRVLADGDMEYDVILGGVILSEAERAVRDLDLSRPSSKCIFWPVEVNIEYDASIEAAFRYVAARFDRIDALVNNAGAQFDPAMHTGEMTMREAFNRSWNVNTTGAQIVTHTFAPLLLKSRDPRLLFLSSGTSNLALTEDPSLPANAPLAKGWPKDHDSSITAYRSSKTGLNMVMREWHRKLEADGVKVWAISPGYLATGLGTSAEVNRSRGAQDPALGAMFIRDVLLGRRDDDVGRVILRDGVQTW